MAESARGVPTRLSLFALLVIVGVGLTTVAGAQQPIRPPIKPGFPVTLPGSGFISAIAVGDLNADGKKEIVVGTRNRQLYVLKPDGTIFGPPGAWPKTLPGMVNSQPVIADVDMDGIPEIIVTTGSTLDPSGAGGLFVFKADGTLLWSFTPGDIDGGPNGIPDGIFSSPAVGDIDGDGRPDIVVGAFDHRLYAFRGHNGAPLPGWEGGILVGDTVFSSPALADLDGDGRLEVIVGVDTHQEPPGTGPAPPAFPTNDPNVCRPHQFHSPNGGALFVFRSNGTLFPGFPVCINETMMSSPAVGDITGDGTPKIVVGTGRFWSTTTGQPVGRNVHAFRNDGTVLPGWPKTVGNIVFSSPALADLDGDGILDVVVGSDDTGLYAFKGTGAVLWAVQPRSFFGTVHPIATSPMVADVLGTGQVQVLIPLNTEIAVLRGFDGAQFTDNGTHLGQLSFFTETAVNAEVVVTDLDPNDGKIDVIVGSATPFPSGTDGKLWVFQPGPSGGKLPWPQFHRNGNHTGCVGAFCTPPPPPFTGGIFVAAADVTPTSVPPGAAEIIVGSGPGRPPEVRIYRNDKTLFGRIFPYSPLFDGGVRVAACDFNGDGKADIVTAAGPGGGPHVQVISGADLTTVLMSFFAYSPSFTGGVWVACGDINGDGTADIVTGADAGGGPHVRVFDGKNPGHELFSFFAYNPAFTGGVRVAVGDVNGDGHADIITAAGPGGGPHVQVFSGVDLTPLASFFAYSPTFTGGVYVAAGHVLNSGAAQIITGADAGGGPHVKVFSGTGVELAGFFAYDPVFTGGVRVGVGNVTGVGSLSEIVTGAGPGGGPHVRTFDGTGMPIGIEFMGF